MKKIDDGQEITPEFLLALIFLFVLILAVVDAFCSAFGM
jgi:hypothetical protein